MCNVCDAPEVLSEALHRTVELGLPLSYQGCHNAMMAWAERLELGKLDQVRAGGGGAAWIMVARGGSAWFNDCGGWVLLVMMK